MKRVPKEIISEMNRILFVDDNKTITDYSSKCALEYAKAQEKKYKHTLLIGLFLEIRAYKKKLRLEKKRKQLTGDENE